MVGVPGQAGIVLGPIPAGLSHPESLLVGPGPALYLTDLGADVVLVAR